MYPGWKIWMDVWSEIFDWTLAGGSGGDFGWKFWNGPRLGESEGFLVGKRDSEALSETDGDVFGRSKIGCPLVKRTGPGLVNVWNGCEVGSLTGRLLKGAKTKVACSYAPRRPF